MLTHAFNIYLTLRIVYTWLDSSAHLGAVNELLIRSSNVLVLLAAAPPAGRPFADLWAPWPLLSVFALCE